MNLWSLYLQCLLETTFSFFLACWHARVFLLFVNVFVFFVPNCTLSQKYFKHFRCTFNVAQMMYWLVCWHLLMAYSWATCVHLFGTVDRQVQSLAFIYAHCLETSNGANLVKTLCECCKNIWTVNNLSLEPEAQWCYVLPMKSLALGQELKAFL